MAESNIDSLRSGGSQFAKTHLRVETMGICIAAAKRLVLPDLSARARFVIGAIDCAHDTLRTRNRERKRLKKLRSGITLARRARALIVGECGFCLIDRKRANTAKGIEVELVVYIALPAFAIFLLAGLLFYMCLRRWGRHSTRSKKEQSPCGARKGTRSILRPVH